MVQEKVHISMNFLVVEVDYGNGIVGGRWRRVSSLPLNFVVVKAKGKRRLRDLMVESGPVITLFLLQISHFLLKFAAMNNMG
ncbi:hypothetical protein QVD17_05587 [Tagetes erecta]|uniref:Uncharacterized protein n=1 Tax=Tagetes erecta TaxID=13708 RepID=A0AAD8LK26_TARER|nr:hypothetical protein QVD17_05587 [Tagetes erecta]